MQRNCWLSELGHSKKGRSKVTGPHNSILGFSLAKVFVCCISALRRISFFLFPLKKSSVSVWLARIRLPVKIVTVNSLRDWGVHSLPAVSQHYWTATSLHTGSSLTNNLLITGTVMLKMAPLETSDAMSIWMGHGPFLKCSFLLTPPDSKSRSRSVIMQSWWTDILIPRICLIKVAL